MHPLLYIQASISGLRSGYPVVKYANYLTVVLINLYYSMWLSSLCLATLNLGIIDVFASIMSAWDSLTTQPRLVLNSFVPQLPNGESSHLVHSSPF